MKVTMDDLLCTGPSTLAGRYLRSFWQPVLRSGDLASGQALPVRIMSEDFTLFRGTSGKPQLLAPRCAHRLTRLHTGTVDGDTISCLYHGWRYDCTGQCVYQPAERETFTQATKIMSYPTQDYIGLIWAYLGEGAAPLLRFPDFERPGLISVSPPEIWPCNYFNRLDNVPDVMHAHFTHKESMTREGRHGSGTEHGLPELSFDETEFGIETTVSSPTFRAYFHFIMPNINAIAATVGRVEGFRDDPRYWKAEVFIRVPIDDTHCLGFSVVFIDVQGDEAEAFLERRKSARETLQPDRLIVETAEAVLAGRKRIADMEPRMGSAYSFLVEDYVTQVGQGPVADREHERLGRHDRGVVMLRRIWMRELQALADGKELKNWVIPAGLFDKTEPQPSWAARSQASEVAPLQPVPAK